MVEDEKFSYFGGRNRLNKQIEYRAIFVASSNENSMTES